jgi:hypothetical protein
VYFLSLVFPPQNTTATIQRIRTKKAEETASGCVANELLGDVCAAGVPGCTGAET